MSAESLRAIPSVDAMLRRFHDATLPRAAMTSLIRRKLNNLRGQNLDLSQEEIVLRLETAINNLQLARIRPVINGTGVVIHTNLGRAPLGKSIVEALSEVAANYNNLEFDLATGERGVRGSYLEHNLAVLCGAEAATVVNNCAAALVLILRHFTSGARKEVVISRGELLQIGGGFRIPDILQASGAVLREVGTTNKTTAADYEAAICAATAMILKVHPSNFYMEGFVESPPTDQLALLAHHAEIPLVEDLGSGAVFNTELLAPIDHEPMPGELLKRGVDLVCFSGDKLFGGPQAGIIAGNAQYVATLKREPFFRALRCDKLILCALQETVDLHLQAAGVNGHASQSVPIVDMLTQTWEAMTARANALLEGLRDLPLTCQIGNGESKVGGGTLPKASIPSVTLDLLPRMMSAQALAAKLRANSPAVISTLSKDLLKIDLRTVFPRQDTDLLKAIRSVLT